MTAFGKFKMLYNAAPSSGSTLAQNDSSEESVVKPPNRLNIDACKKESILSERVVLKIDKITNIAKKNVK